MSPLKLSLVRLLGILVVAFGAVYILWRWTDTLAMSALWLSIPLALAETYSFLDSVLYALTMWNARRRPAPPAAAPGHTVDVFITTYNEPLDLVLKTTLAARAIRYPHRTHILDDGDRPAFRRAAGELGIGYITRGHEWDGRPRFAKAGNINNALFHTEGEFVAILDADQVPSPEFLDHVLGYFENEKVAFVQTPQHFWNVGRKDPLGSSAELFYGPIQQGKDGWDSAFFCGSNAVLRREAVMTLGLARHGLASVVTARTAVRRAAAVLNRRGVVRGRYRREQQRLRDSALMALRAAGDSLRLAESLTTIDTDLQLRLAAIRREARSVPGPLASAIGIAARTAGEGFENDAPLAFQPMSTTSITEDTATALNLHAMGWSSVYHHEVLVRGLAPDDLPTMLSQRARWATGTMQVLFSRELNPALVPGLTLGQRVMYLATMTSYLSGFATLAYLAAPLVFLFTGIFPLQADAVDFFGRFLPFFVLCQVFFYVAGNGCRGIWKGQQMALALFPTWLRSCLEGFAGAILHRKITFVVTSKSRDAGARATALRAVAPPTGRHGRVGRGSRIRHLAPDPGDRKRGHRRGHGGDRAVPRLGGQ